MDQPHGYYTRLSGVRGENQIGTQGSSNGNSKEKPVKGRKQSKELVNTPQRAAAVQKAGKNQTPSGQILTSSVKDIRNFFQLSPSAVKSPGSGSSAVVSNSINRNESEEMGVSEENSQSVLQQFAEGVRLKQCKQYQNQQNSAQ